MYPAPGTIYHGLTPTSQDPNFKITSQAPNPRSPILRTPHHTTAPTKLSRQNTKHNQPSQPPPQPPHQPPHQLPNQIDVTLQCCLPSYPSCEPSHLPSKCVIQPSKGPQSRLSSQRQGIHQRVKLIIRCGSTMLTKQNSLTARQPSPSPLPCTRALAQRGGGGQRNFVPTTGGPVNLHT